MTLPAGGWLSMGAFRLFREVGEEALGKKLMPAEVTAKIEGFPIVFVVERGGFLHGHSTNGVLGHGFRFIHGRVSFWVVVTPREVVNAGLFLGNLADHDQQQHHQSHADHRPKPHPAARPAAHPTVSLVHHGWLCFIGSRWAAGWESWR